jgi:hypothetical protein
MKLRIQKRLKEGRRIPTLGCLDPAIRRAVEKECKIYGVKPSFVVNNACSFAMNVPLETESYRQIETKGKLKIMRRA